jgi:dienelactone hydrolase
MRPLACLCLASLAASVACAAPVENGTFRFSPVDDQKDVPERYRLEAREVRYEMALRRELPASGVRVFALRFPSPLPSAHEENNTVHAEYYRPTKPGPFPGVIVLDITGGDQSLSRNMATLLASKGIAGLFVQMAYYGPRRPPNSRLRLLSTNIPQTMTGVRQTVLDLRVAASWLASRPEIDGKRLGIVGTSLGSFMAALTGEMEPRLGRVVVLLGGGGFVDAYYDHPKAARYRKMYENLGGSKEKLAELLAPVDPLTCAANLKRHRLLIMAGKRDEIVPPKMAEALWKASGRQRIVWYDCGHYGAIVYILSAMDEIVKHCNAP